MRTNALPDECAPKLCVQEISDKTVAPFACEFFLYASKIEETTDGSRRGTRGQARQGLEVIAERRIEEYVQIDEQKRATQNGENEAQGEADTQAQEEVELSWPLL